MNDASTKHHHGSFVQLCRFQSSTPKKIRSVFFCLLVHMRETAVVRPCIVHAYGLSHQSDGIPSPLTILAYSYISSIGNNRRTDYGVAGLVVVATMKWFCLQTSKNASTVGCILCEKSKNARMRAVWWCASQAHTKRLILVHINLLLSFGDDYGESKTVANEKKMHEDVPGILRVALQPIIHKTTLQASGRDETWGFQQALFHPCAGHFLKIMVCGAEIRENW